MMSLGRFTLRQVRRNSDLHRTLTKTTSGNNGSKVLPPKPKPKTAPLSNPVHKPSTTPTSASKTTTAKSTATATTPPLKPSPEDQALAFLAERARSLGSPLSLEERKLILKEAGFHQHGRLKPSEWNRLVSSRNFADQERLTLHDFIAKSHDGILGQRLLQNTARLGIGFFAMCGSHIAAEEADFHIMGATLVGCVTALGGGTINGLVTGATPVGWVKDPKFLMITVGASWLGFYIWPLVEEALDINDDGVENTNSDTVRDSQEVELSSSKQANNSNVDKQIQDDHPSWLSLESVALGTLAVVGALWDPTLLIITVGASWLAWPFLGGTESSDEDNNMNNNDNRNLLESDKNIKAAETNQPITSSNDKVYDLISDPSLLRYSMESVGLGALAIAGAQQGIVRGLHPLVSASLGVTITLGGVMRDLMCHRDLALGASTGCQSYGIASFSGAAVYVALRQLHVWNCAGNTSKLLSGGIPLTLRVLLGFSTVFGIRAVAWHYKPDGLLLNMEESAKLNQKRIQSLIQQFTG